jgi:Uma2 family endonuclease
VRKERLATLTDQQWKKFLPLCPDFILELRSPSGSIRALGMKMEEYMRNGALLGWMIDPDPKAVHVYRPNSAPEVLNNPLQLSGDPVLPGFTLDLPQLWTEMRH